MRILIASLIAVLMGSSASAQSENAVGGVVAGQCSHIKAPLMSKIGSLQMELYNSMELLKAELTAMRKTQEAGLLEIKNTLLMQVVEARKEQRKRPSAESSRRSVADAVAKQLEKVSADQAKATAKLRRDVVSELGKMERRLSFKLRPRPSTNCAQTEQRLRRVANGMCTAATRSIQTEARRLATSSREAQARLQRTLTSGLNRHQQQLNISDAKQQVAMENLLRVLGYDRTANGSRCAKARETGMIEQYVNVALRKKTRQSSTGWKGSSSRAVDGNTNGYYASRTCTHTNNRGRKWWTVDLGRAYLVHSVVLWNRVDCCANRLRGFKVWLSTKSGYVSSGSKSSQAQCSGPVGPWSSVNPKITVSCGSQMARYVTVSKTNRENLCLCEVEVLTQTFNVSSSFKLEDEFMPITVRDMDVAAAGQVVGRYPTKTCGAQCLLRGRSCRGFYASTTDQCILFTTGTATGSWKERPAAKDVKIWVRRDGGRYPKCTAARFPYTRGRSRYRVVRSKLQWRAAVRVCQSMGAKLVQVSSEQERIFVHRLMRKENAHTYYHVGLYQRSKTSEPRGNWYWHSSGDKFTLAYRWKRTQPDNYKNLEDFGMMYTATGLFNDIMNSDRYPSVCECFVV